MAARSAANDRAGGRADGEEADTYSSQEELIDDLLAVVRMRAQTAALHADLITRDDPLARVWPAELREREALIERRLASPTSLLPLQMLRRRFELEPDAERVIWTLLAHEICPVARQLLRDLGTEQASDLSTDIVRRVVFGCGAGLNAWSVLGDQSTLRRYGLLTPTGGSEAPDHRQTWKLSRRILALAHGDQGLDLLLSDYAVASDVADSRLNELEVVGDVFPRLERAFERRGFVLVVGRAGSGRRSVLRAVAARRGISTLEVQARALSRDLARLREQLRTIARECRLFEMVPLVKDLDALAGSAEESDRIDLIVAEFGGLVLATAGRPIARRWSRPPTVVELQPISGQQRERLWRRALPKTSEVDPALLATMYPLAPTLIEATAAVAIEDAGMSAVSASHLQAALRAVLDDRLAGLASRKVITQTWDDLVLPDDQGVALAELLARIRQRTRVYEEWGFGDKIGKGLGVSALFSGPPGTGKSMAAGLVAKELNTELYQVDLSKVVSKWIGETEKNLAALFDAAEAGHAILLFDEADALFGKRTDVKSSNDRHANQEVNFLLQRLESFAGVCILTSNHETAMDEAFRRRLSVHVRFPMPEADERLKLWQRMLPRQAPVEGKLDLEELADKFVMSGGYIRNAMLRAAFLAADERGSINRTRLSRAAQLEYEAMGKVVASR